MSLLKYFYKRAMNLPGWMPDWIKKHPEIKKAPNNIRKEFPFDDFIKEIKDEVVFDYINSGIVDIFAENLSIFIRNLQYFINYLSDEDVNQVKGVLPDHANLFIKKRNQLLQVFNIYEDQIKDALINKYVQIGKNKYKLFALIQKAIDLSNEFSNIILSGAPATNYERIKNVFNITRRYQDVDGFSLFSKKDIKQDLFIVFSTKPEDLLRMSSSSNWTSCQNIFSGVSNSCLTGNVLHSGSGIIYITNNKDFKGTGPEIIYRSIVRLLEPKEGGAYVCLLSKVYPINSKAIINLFKQSIEEKGIKVLEPTDNIDNYELAFTNEDYDYTYNAYEEPRTNKPEKYHLLNNNWEINKNLQNTESFEKMLSNKIDRELFFEQFEKAILNSNNSELNTFVSFNTFLNDRDISSKVYREFIRKYKAWQAGNKYLDDEDSTIK